MRYEDQEFENWKILRNFVLGKENTFKVRIYNYKLVYTIHYKNLSSAGVTLK